ncbi:MAG: hypothetical protein OEZ10_07400 [Gammaproteobacteria bacterium]|nr:hypothetical protein [Gammaproteobacteria bacterium]
MSLDKALNDAIAQIPECVAAGYVDLSSGMLLGVKTVDSHPGEVLEIVAAATADMYQGSNVTMIENMFKKSRGVPTGDGHHYFQEMMVLSDNLLHIFSRCKGNEDHVCVFVCRKSANMGMALAKVRSNLPTIEAAL